MTGMPDSKNADEVRKEFLILQNDIIEKFSKLKETSFLKDEWKRDEGGGGISAISQDGNVFDKVGVNFSDIYGDSLPSSATEKRKELKGKNYRAMGVSVVSHPRNPHIPTVHLNVRFFIAFGKDSPPIWWFGGGFDMTPYYGYEEDVKEWHISAKKMCDKYDKNIYTKLKKNCDEYFYIKHRNEPRGIGGIFFDDLNLWEFDTCLSFVKSVGSCFIDTYIPIIERRMETKYSDQEKDFQLFRRGRYVEFNLVYDRGTLFGLQSKGRSESILMSLPPLVKWKYNYPINEGSKEEELYKKYLVKRNWI